MADKEIDTRLVDVKGRSIVVKQLKDTQLLLMGRDAEVLDNPDADGRRKLRAAGYILDMFETAIVQQFDREYVMGLARSGDLELADFLGFLSAFEEKPAEEKKPVVRRGRPPRKSA